MTMLNARLAPLGRIGVGGATHSVWRNFVSAVLKARDRNVEDEVAEYLHRYRHDLPPEVWIELERHRREP
jgi:hypothetical protein